MRKGITVTVTQCKVILGLVTAASVLALSTTVIYGIYFFDKKIETPHKEKIIKLT